ncbi:PREDICTED: glutathione S-transferase T2-like [Brassica oleracea var. oleracea]|uniref:glutathione S-transferase T2-like n=1 Tax=Brassica oleracea var. oleracea TaxID=109376 RepID=UPI0006A6D6E1|nr:PREDICTED: glutathione S-transferase T2-like [Brassica oleracea var. oleracea]
MRGERGSVSLFRHFSLSKPNCLHFVSELGEGDSPTLADIPVILPLSTPPNGILCLCGSSEKANLPLSPWIYWNRKMAGSSVLKQGSFYRRIRSITGRVPLSSSQVPSFGSQAVELPAERKERRTWTVTEDIVLISSWLNTSKDSVVGNEQKSATFWNRVAAYFSASPKLAGCEKHDGNQCKQRWHKLNEAVCKFSGEYEAATREKTSGMNDNDVLKLAHEIYFNNQQKKFSLEHAWNELRNDQKRKFADGSHSGACSQVNECDAGVEGTSRPPGVKVAKARGKKPYVAGQDVSDYQLMWSIKKDDLAMKQHLSKMRVLEKPLAKENLANYEEDLKKKLINELM